MNQGKAESDTELPRRRPAIALLFLVASTAVFTLMEAWVSALIEPFGGWSLGGSVPFALSGWYFIAAAVLTNAFFVAAASTRAPERRRNLVEVGAFMCVAALLFSLWELTIGSTQHAVQDSGMPFGAAQQRAETDDRPVVLIATPSGPRRSDAAEMLAPRLRVRPC